MILRPTRVPRFLLKPSFGTVEIDGGRGVAQGLIAAFLMNEGGGSLHNLAQPYQPVGSLGSGDSWAATPLGLGVTFDGSSAANNRILCGTSYSTQMATAKALTMFVALTAADPTGNHGVIDQTAAGDNTNSFAQIFMESNTWKFRVYDGVSIFDTVGSAPSAGYQTVAGTWATGDKLVNLYVNGVASGTPSTTNFDVVDSGGNLLLGSLGSGVYPHSGALVVAYVWSRALSAGEIFAIHVDPYAFLRPKVARQYFFPAAAAAGGLGWKLVGQPARLAGRGGLAA